MMPSISVIITTHNRAQHFLPRAIQSVKDQTFTDWELLVVDDASTDHTIRVVKSFAEGDSRITYECTPQNTGYQCVPKNMGIRGTRAPLIAYLDDDNAWHPTHLERLKDSIGDADLAYCNRAYVNDPVFPHPSPPILGEAGPNGFPWDPHQIIFENWIDTSDILHTRSSVVRLGGWDENVRRAADWNLLVRYANTGRKVVHVNETLTTYYWHSHNIGRLPLGRIAVWTLTKNRLWYVQQMLRGIRSMIGLDFDHYVLDQGSTDGTADFLAEEFSAGRLAYFKPEPSNIGISRGSNHLLDVILPGDYYHWIVKLDSDIVVQTPLFLERMVQRWTEKHVLSPHILGLVNHPGGAPRTSRDALRRLGYAKHLGGACNVAPYTAWKEFGRWAMPAPAHGMQDSEFSQRMRDCGYKLAYVEDVLARHLGNTPDEIRAEERRLIV